MRSLTLSFIEYLLTGAMCDEHYAEILGIKVNKNRRYPYLHTMYNLVMKWPH